MKSLRRSVVLFVSFFLSVLDLISKEMAIRYLQNQSGWKLTPFLELFYVENRDVAFSLLHWLPYWMRMPLILGIGLSMTGFILWTLVRSPSVMGWGRYGFMLILSGALGNLYDRIVRGYVIDFIHLFLGDLSWPIFNFADIYISVGVFLVVISMFFSVPTPLNEIDVSKEQS